MKKEITKDYAESAFQYYVGIGKPSYDSLKERYIKDALEDYSIINKKVISIDDLGSDKRAMDYVDDKLKTKAGEVEDILAIEKTLKLLNETEKLVLEIIYFSSDNPIKKANMSELVKKACTITSLPEKTIHSYLRKARVLFALERGLRVY